MFCFSYFVPKNGRVRTLGRFSSNDQPTLNMQLNRIMTEYVEVIAPEMSIQEAAEQMRSLDVGVLPVCNGDRLVGILTDRDLAVRAVADGRDPKITTPDLTSSHTKKKIGPLKKIFKPQRSRQPFRGDSVGT